MQEGEKMGDEEGEREGWNRESGDGGGEEGPASKEITIFAYVNYRLTRMNDRPR